MSYKVTYDYDFLEHHGILGQKWGVRRYQNPDGTLTEAGKKKYSYGAQYTTSKNEKVNVLVSKPHIFEHERGSDGHTGKEIETVHKLYANGKRVAIAYLDSKNGDMNINWISTKTKEEGKGYCQTLMDHAIKYSKDTGHRTMSLEVPDGDDNAAHIYKKKGFEYDGKVYEDYLKGMRKKL